MPESGTGSYGDIHITIEAIHEKEGFILRKLNLKVSIRVKYKVVVLLSSFVINSLPNRFCNLLSFRSI